MIMNNLVVDKATYIFCMRVLYDIDPYNVEIDDNLKNDQPVFIITNQINNENIMIIFIETDEDKYDVVTDEINKLNLDDIDTIKNMIDKIYMTLCLLIHKYNLNIQITNEGFIYHDNKILKLKMFMKPN